MSFFFNKNGTQEVLGSYFLCNTHNANNQPTQTLKGLFTLNRTHLLMCALLLTQIALVYFMQHAKFYQCMPIQYIHVN